MDNNKQELGNKEEIIKYKVGDHVYFEDFQNQYFNEDFFEEYEEATWQLRLCHKLFARFEPTNSIEGLNEDRKSEIFTNMVEELKRLPCPPSKMMLDDTEIRCVWFLPNPIHEDWFDNEDSLSIFCYKIRNQFSDLENCVMSDQFSAWIDDGIVGFTPEEYMKSVYRVNQFFNVLGLKITVIED